jgi:catalase
LQLPINAPRKAVATNQRDGQMAYRQDLVEGVNAHVNYEPSSLGGLKEAAKAGKDHTPHYNASLVREKISRQNNFKQAGETYRNHEEWEREDLINNLVNTLAPAKKHIQDKMVEMFKQCDADYGRRVEEGLRKAATKNIDKGPIGSTQSHQAVKQAEEISQEGKEY